MAHGNCNHTTEECNALKAEAKRLKTQNGSGGKVTLKGKSKNKT